MKQPSNQGIDTKPYEALVLSIILAVAIFFIRYPEVVEWNLDDNDNLMRFHQLMTFIESHPWCLRPLNDFNAQDKQVIHWSRIPDLPILALYFIITLASLTIYTI